MKVTTVLVVSLFLFSCAHSKVENQFKILSPKLNEVLIELKKMPTVKQDLQPDGSVNLYIDYEPRKKYVANIRSPLESLLNDLHQLAMENPLDKWSDDILFMEAITYMQISDPDEANKYTDNTISIIEMLLKKYKHIKIEPWTKKVFRDSFFDEYERSLTILYASPKEDVIVNDLTFFLAKQYEKKRDFNTALTILKAIKGKYVDSEMDRQIKAEIIHVEDEMEKSLRKETGGVSP